MTRALAVAALVAGLAWGAQAQEPCAIPTPTCTTTEVTSITGPPLSQTDASWLASIPKGAEVWWRLPKAKECSDNGKDWYGARHGIDGSVVCYAKDKP